MSDNLTDPSRSTAQFRAFVEGAAGEPERGWSMKAPGAKVAIFAAIVVVVAVILAVVSLTVA